MNQRGNFPTCTKNDHLKKTIIGNLNERKHQGCRLFSSTGKKKKKYSACLILYLVPSVLIELKQIIPSKYRNLFSHFNEISKEKGEFKPLPGPVPI
jgi:hypothetical protein